MAEADPVQALSGQAIKGADAAAILLMVLGDEEASELLGLLEPGEVQKLGSAMFRVSDVSERNVNEVFDMFISRARQTTSIGFGAAPRIRSVMENALGHERAENVLAKITPPKRTNALDALRWMDAKTIAGIIAEEHPQVAALTLSHLDHESAAEVLQLLPGAAHAEIIYRIATLDAVSAEALEDLERILVSQVNRAAAPSSLRGGAGEAAKIMNNMTPGSDQPIIRAVSKLDKGLAQTIQDEMFVFTDLLGCDDKNLGLLMRSVETSTLVVALKGADEGMRDRIFACMSARAADTIKDEMEEKGPMRLSEVLEAQKEILAVARRLSEEGTLMLPGRGGDYV